MEFVEWVQGLNGSLRPDTFLEGIPLFLGVGAAFAALTVIFLRKEIRELRKDPDE